MSKYVLYTKDIDGRFSVTNKISMTDIIVIPDEEALKEFNSDLDAELYSVYEDELQGITEPGNYIYCPPTRTYISAIMAERINWTIDKVQKEFDSYFGR